MIVADDVSEESGEVSSKAGAKTTGEDIEEDCLEVPEDEADLDEKTPAKELENMTKQELVCLLEADQEFLQRLLLLLTIFTHCGYETIHDSSRDVFVKSVGELVYGHAKRMPSSCNGKLVIGN